MYVMGLGTTGSEEGFIFDNRGIRLAKLDRTNGGDEIGVEFVTAVNNHHGLLDALNNAETFLGSYGHRGVYDRHGKKIWSIDDADSVITLMRAAIEKAERGQE